MMFITYQTFVVRTPHHTILVDTCTGEDKGHPAPVRFPWQRTLAERAVLPSASATTKSITCSARICISTTPAWNTTLRDGRWVPTFPNAKYIFHKREYAAWGSEGKRARRQPARHGLPRQLPADRRGRPGAAGR